MLFITYVLACLITSMLIGKKIWDEKMPFGVVVMLSIGSFFGAPFVWVYWIFVYIDAKRGL